MAMMDDFYIKRKKKVISAYTKKIILVILFSSSSCEATSFHLGTKWYCVLFFFRERHFNSCLFKWYSKFLVFFYYYFSPFFFIYFIGQSTFFFEFPSFQYMIAHSHYPVIHHPVLQIQFLDLFLLFFAPLLSLLLSISPLIVYFDFLKCIFSLK